MSSDLDNPDYKETLNVTRAHAAGREKGAPTVRHEPLPLWVFVGSSIIFMLGGGFLGGNAVGFNMLAFTPRGYVPKNPGGARAVATEEGGEWLPKWIKSGEKVYKGKGACITCHQSNGGGTPGVFPPLAGSEWVGGSDERMAMILLHGLSGQLIVGGKPFNGQMPPQGAMLSDKEIAQVMSFVRSSWGNSASFLTEEKVAAAREKHGGHAGTFTQADLEAVPADQMLPGADVDPVTGNPPIDPAAQEPAATNDNPAS